MAHDDTEREREVGKSKHGVIKETRRVLLEHVLVRDLSGTL